MILFTGSADKPEGSTERPGTQPSDARSVLASNLKREATPTTPSKAPSKVASQTASKTASKPVSRTASQKVAQTASQTVSRTALQTTPHMSARVGPQAAPLTESNGGREMEAWNMWHPLCMDDGAEIDAGETAGAGKGAGAIGAVNRNRVRGFAFSSLFRQTSCLKTAWREVSLEVVGIRGLSVDQSYQSTNHSNNHTVLTDQLINPSTNRSNNQ